MTLYTESITDQTDHFAHDFVRGNDVYGYDVQKYTAGAILLREIMCKKMDNFML